MASLAPARPCLGALLIALSAPLAAAEDAPVLAVESAVELGWTTNATDSALALPDRFLRHRHALGFGGVGDGMELRGALSVEETRFTVHDFEDDRAISLDLEAGMRATEAVALRGALTLTGTETGDDLLVPGLGYLATHTVSLEAGAGVEIAHQTPQRDLSLGGEARLIRAGDTAFPGTGIAPLRLSPDIDLYGLRALWRERLSPEIAASASVALARSLVPETDRLAFGRPEVMHASASLGIEAMPAAGLRIGVEGGLHGLESPQLPGWRAIVPAFSVVAGMDLTEALGVSVERAQAIVLADPVDGVAGFTDRTTLAVTLRPAPQLSLRLEGFAASERGMLLSDIETRERGASLAGTLALGPQAEARLVLSHAETDDSMQAYDARTITLGLIGRLTP